MKVFAVNNQPSPTSTYLCRSYTMLSVGVGGAPTTIITDPSFTAGPSQRLGIHIQGGNGERAEVSPS